MNRKKRMIGLMLGVILTIGMSATVYASAQKPYGTMWTRIYNNYASSYISKCDCNPVGNYLYAGLRVQYSQNGQYIWDPVSDYLYIYSDGTNVASRSISVNHSNINYAYGYSKARCTISGGSMHIYSMEDRN